jgi:hypothetical protein
VVYVMVLLGCFIEVPKKTTLNIKWDNSDSNLGPTECKKK